MVEYGQDLERLFYKRLENEIGDFKYDNLVSGQFIPTGEDPNLFMKPDNWTPSLHGSNNTAYEVRIPLTIEDTTSRPTTEGWGSRGRTIPLPAGFNIDSDAARTNLEFKNVFGFLPSKSDINPCKKTI